MHASMTTSELVNVIKSLNPDIECVWGERGQVGIYYGGNHVGGITKSGTLPPRTIRDANDVIEVRGWMDVLAGLYASRMIPKTRKLARLMGAEALAHLSLAGTLPIEPRLGIPGTIKRDRSPERHEWMGKEPGTAA